MSKVTLSDLESLSNQTSATATLNANSDIIETAFNNTLSLDGTAPNIMGADLDMDSHRIINLPAPITGTEPLRLHDVTTIGVTPVLTALSTLGTSLVTALSAAAGMTVLTISNAAQSVITQTTNALMLTQLGVTVAAQSVLAQVSNAAMLTQLGITAAAQSVLTQVSNATMLTQLGVTAAAQSVLTQATNALILTQLGITTIGKAVFVAASNNAAQVAIGMAGTFTTSAQTVGTSPATITCGSSPETHYYLTNTTNISAVTQNGQSIMQAVNPKLGAVMLWPGEAYIVTWSTGAPTYAKVIH